MPQLYPPHRKCFVLNEETLNIVNWSLKCLYFSQGHEPGQEENPGNRPSKNIRKCSKIWIKAPGLIWSNELDINIVQIRQTLEYMCRQYNVVGKCETILRAIERLEAFRILSHSIILISEQGFSTNIKGLFVCGI